MTIPKKKHGRPTRKPDNDTLRELYAVKTAKQIANEYEVATVTVRKWIQQAREA